MLCRFFWLRLNVKITCKADASAVINSHFHQICHIVLLFCHIRIEQSIVTLSTSPENIALTAEFNGNFKGFFNLRRRISKHLGIRRCSRTAHISWIIKAVRRAPKKFYARSFHFRFYNRNNFLKIVICFL